MIVVILFGIFFAMALALVIARFGPNPRAVDQTFYGRDDDRPRLQPAALRSLVIDLLDALGLTVVEEELVGDERRLIAANRGDAELARSRYVVFVEPQPAGDTVSQQTALELAEVVKGERAVGGMLITPYAIERAGLGFEVPIELIDGPRLGELVARYLPERMGELRRYHGFAPSVIAPTTTPLPS